MAVSLERRWLLTLGLIPLLACGGSDPVLAGGGGGAVDPRLERAFPQLHFERPTDLQSPPDGSHRLFVLEQDGRVRVFPNRPDAGDAGVFLNLAGKVSRGGSEEGLLGLAFHPHFAKNGYFYLNFTAPNPLRTVVARFTADPRHPGQADPASEKVILEFPQPYSNHNGGQIAFGPDGDLYIGTGDGGSEYDPQRYGQNRKTLLAKILRIDVDHPSGGRAYGIPADNPWAGNREGWREETYAWGLRNPWRFSFDRDTGRLWCGDVGQDKIEEVDLIEKGKNYGWSVMEGKSCFHPAEGCNQAGLTLPIWQYTHSVGQSITGGYVYRGKAVPSLQGAYLYADFVAGKLWALRYDGRKVTENRLLQDSRLNIASFGQDENRELYALAFDGQIYRLR